LSFFAEAAKTVGKQSCGPMTLPLSASRPAAFETLDAIGRRFNTDKASVFRDPNDGQEKIGNDYLRHYDQAFLHLRHHPVLIVEMGIGYGEEAGNSLRMWDEYFTHNQARIVGVDIEEHHRRFAGGRIGVEIGDCGAEPFLNELGRRYDSADIIVDDASHYWIHQVTACRVLFRYLRPGGLYVIEDLGTSFNEPVREIYGAPGGDDAYAFLLSLLTGVVGNTFYHPVRSGLPIPDHNVMQSIDDISFARGTAIIRKREIA
jgi:SAM-dependent methyltransferase